MEHSLHLTAGHFLSCITPVKPVTAHEGGTDNKNDELSEDDGYCDDSSTITAEALHKLLGLIKQVSPIHHSQLS